MKHYQAQIKGYFYSIDIYANSKAEARKEYPSIKHIWEVK